MILSNTFLFSSPDRFLTGNSKGETEEGGFEHDINKLSLTKIFELVKTTPNISKLNYSSPGTLFVVRKLLHFKD